ncbi:MAG TPA: zf-HC2 domain-containing protein, partial [Vicinamibacteria bacterium]|nr:zf-HC2 domain-containing protein [Vicinamibacteria bacterium]
MECNAFRDEMLDVLYGEGDPAARRRFEEHQESCAPCRAELLGLRRLRGQLAAWPLPPALRPRRAWPGRA